MSTLNKENLFNWFIAPGSVKWHSIKNMICDIKICYGSLVI